MHLRNFMKRKTIGEWRKAAETKNGVAICGGTESGKEGGWGKTMSLVRSDEWIGISGVLPSHSPAAEINIAIHMPLIAQRMLRFAETPMVKAFRKFQDDSGIAAARNFSFSLAKNSISSML